MTATFFYLTACSLRNRAMSRLRRLRQPRYLIGLLVGVAYFYWFIIRHQLRGARNPGDFTADPQFAALVPAILVVGGLGLWAISLLAWFWPSREPPLRFTRPEVQFFFTAPVSRRQIVHYKLLRSQIGIVFGVLIVSLFTGAAVSGRVWFLLGGWMLFSTLRLHLVGVAFTRASLQAGGLRDTPRGTWVPPGLVGIVAAVILGTIALHLPALLALPFPGIVERVIALGREGAMAAALWPFKALIAPVLAVTASQFLASAWPGAALLAGNYWWVLRSEATLEEAAIAAERQEASSRRRPAVPVSRNPPFELAPVGRAETAILWKNLVLAGRFLSPRTLVRFAAPLVILAVVAGARGRALGFAPVALIVAGALTLIGPYMVRSDLRQDLPRLAVLKTWPIRGATLVRGELLAPAVLLTLGVWIALAVALGLSAGLGLEDLDFADRAWLALAAAVAAPSFLLAQLVIQNGAVVLFPGWIPTGAARPRGLEALGQQLLMLAGTLVLMALGVLPAAVVAGAAGFVFFTFVGYAGIVPAAALFSAVLLAEVLLVVELLGRVIEGTDPTHVEAGEE
ncbi:MAG TPA: putative ABC exporter domain-containing protein [Vicinamibacterales bacterium]|nr:putative ABC exporter domain-containing protein [Vicinamibacterales bacterium]